jgi:hypothetical protein
MLDGATAIDASNVGNLVPPAILCTAASAATCAETVASVHSVAADFAACAGVSELATDAACSAILTDSPDDDAAAKACTYVAAVTAVTEPAADCSYKTNDARFC